MISVIMCVVFLVAVVCPAAQDKVDLKLRLKAGEKYDMKMTSTQKMTQLFMGQEQTSNQTNEMVMSMNCLSVDANGVMDIEATYKYMKMTMDGPMGRIEYDSRNPKPTGPNEPDKQNSNNILSSFLRGGINSGIIGGQYPGISSGASFMSGGLAGLCIDVLAGQLAKTAEKTGEEEATAGLSDIASKKFRMKMTPTGETTTTSFTTGVIFPTNPVGVGDTWHTTSTINPNMPTNLSNTCVLKNRKDGIAYIDTVTKMDMGDSSKAIKTDPNNKVSTQMSGTINSANEIDEKTGLLRKSNMTTNISSVTKMEANPQMPKGMTTSMTITGNTVVEMIK